VRFQIRTISTQYEGDNFDAKGGGGTPVSDYTRSLYYRRFGFSMDSFLYFFDELNYLKSSK
jgi:hypothetical protein